MGNSTSFIQGVLAVGQLLDEGGPIISKKFESMTKKIWLITLSSVIVLFRGLMEPFGKRDVHTSSLEGTPIKIGLYVMDAGQSGAPRLAEWNITSLDSKSGEAWFQWRNATEWGCKLTGVWVDPTTGLLISPGADERGIVPWLPNGTFYGDEGDCRDSTGVPIDGLWTANITARDRLVVERMRQIEALHIKTVDSPNRPESPRYYYPDVYGPPKKRDVGFEDGAGRTETEKKAEEVLRKLVEGFVEDDVLERLVREAQEETMLQFAALLE